MYSITGTVLYTQRPSINQFRRTSVRQVDVTRPPAVATVELAPAPDADEQWEWSTARVLELLHSLRQLIARRVHELLTPSRSFVSERLDAKPLPLRFSRVSLNSNC